MRYLAFLCLLMGLQATAQTGIMDDKAFSFIYPSDWDTAHYQTIPVLFAPEESAADGFRENLNIMAEDAGTTNMSIDEYMVMSLDNLRDAMGSETDKIKVVDYPTGKYKEPGKMIRYSTDKLGDDGRMLSLWQVVVKTNKKFFIITYTSEPTTFQKYFPAVEGIVSTIRFK